MLEPDWTALLQLGDQVYDLLIVSLTTGADGHGCAARCARSNACGICPSW
jgi:hypothetical protein